MLIPDSSQKKVHLPVKIVNGHVQFLYGKGRKMPTLRDGATGHIVLAAADVLDEEWKMELTLERRVPLLKAGDPLLLGFRPDGIPGEQPEALHRPDEPLPPEFWHLAFVLVKLEMPLVLHLRGTKKAKLEGGGCKIPTLNEKAVSLNHAYTRISQVLEPGRLSHTGNVFTKGLYQDKKGWHFLNDLREWHEWAVKRDLGHFNTPKDEATLEGPEPTLPL